MSNWWLTNWRWLASTAGNELQFDDDGMMLMTQLTTNNSMGIFEKIMIITIHSSWCYLEEMGMFRSWRSVAIFASSGSLIKLKRAIALARRQLAFQPFGIKVGGASGCRPGSEVCRWSSDDLIFFSNKQKPIPIRTIILTTKYYTLFIFPFHQNLNI